MMQQGQMAGFGILLYTRVFYKSGDAVYNDKLDNEILKLPKEDFDAATKVGVEMATRGETNMIG